MRLKYTSRRGCYNLCNPSEESISTNIAIYNEDNERIKYVNVKSEYEIEGSDVDEAIYAIEEQIKKVFYSTSMDGWKEMLIFLQDNREELEKGNRQHRIEEIDKQILNLQKEKDLLLTLK